MEAFPSCKAAMPESAPVARRVWLRLHFRYTTAPYGSVDALMKELRDKGYLPGYGVHSKHPDMGILYPLLPDAMKNARVLRRNP